ncbi:3-hydroxybenzoate 6-hydroxylase 1 [Nocardia otitidiscaviarum]|uniref:3-hydroxybenzoate 6-hydroxylase 1 n=1 Tax=Nocardia otitidiscaviarum TaxID=1823 RepID=A0A379JLV7_9NOCA|nr:FAD-dependent oxidoreductase [Nocardia otitidiscaviarum]SUD49488.1 3-hydroxybenzoate 6-hydroxylase 1 [Nocardia otitidiscaviarum]
MTETTAARRVLVVGAGIAGMAAALRFHRDGWDVLVVERAPARRSSGYLVNLHGPGYDAAERLRLVPALRRRDAGFFTTVLVHADGREKLTVPAAITEAAVGTRAVNVFRGDVESVLYDAVAERVEIRFATTVRSVTEHADGVRAELSDGTRVDAELLIGADGLHSGVRELVFGSGTDHLVDMRTLVAAFPLDTVPDHVPAGAGITFIGPGRTAAVMNLGPGRSSAFFTYRSTDPAAEVARGPVDALTGAFVDLGGGIAEALAQLEHASNSAYFDAVRQVTLPRWSRGNVVLLGDAAWCVTVFAGYGAALALHGADRLGAAVAAHGTDTPAALAAWEAELRPEVTKRQALARRGMARFVPPTRAHVWLSETMMRAIQLPGLRGLVRSAVRRANN